MAAYEILLLNTAIPQIQAAQSGDTYVVPRDIAFSTVANLANGTNLLPSLTFSSDTNTGIYREGADALGFTAGGGTNQMVLTSTGLGIGASSPDQKLVVQGGSGTAGMKITDGTYSSFLATISTSGNYGNGSLAGQLYLRGQAGIGFSSNGGGATQMTLDSSGNLGLGVTPGDWNANNKVFQLANNASLFSRSGFTGVAQNFRYDSADTGIFMSAGYATLYYQNAGKHIWAVSTTSWSGSGSNIAALSDAMTLDASGNLGIGETNPTTRLHTSIARAATITSAIFGTTGTGVVNDENRLVIKNINTASGQNYGVGIGGLLEASASNQASLLFYTDSGTATTERARITSGGYFKASDNGTYTGGSTSQTHEFNQSVDNNAVIIYGTNASLTTSGVVFLEAARNTTNNTFYAFSYYNSGAAAYKFRVADSGDVTNTNGTYGTISDAKMKTDIVDAGSQWSDIKALRFRKFKMKDDPSGLVQLGVVAQEVEQTSPGLVDEHADKDAEGNDLGTTTKSVKTSILLMKAAVALQEAMARIEKLEAEVAALKGA